MSKNQIANNKCAETLFEDYYYKFFRMGVEDRPIELIISPQCNLKCSYCYLWKNKEHLFSDCHPSNETIIKNLELVLTWMDKHHFHPPLELFSGELLAQTVGYEILEHIYIHQQALPAELRIPYVLIPSNFTWICSDDLVQKIDTFRIKFESLGIRFYLSASVDGKYIESNRSYDKDLDIEIDVVRDDAYYDKLFDYCMKYHICFHPMVYSRHIGLWKKNFDWFMEQFEKHHMSIWGFYLLEVRNEEWAQEDIIQFQDFLRHIYQKMWESCNGDKDEYVAHLFNHYENLNITGGPIWSTDKGLSCSVQNSLCIRLDDLSTPLCHRTGYEHLLIGHWIPDEKNILTFENKNIELMATVTGAQVSALPYCNGCMINCLCIGQCLGACYESNRNLFVPIPSVCALEFGKTMVFMEQALRYGIYEQVLQRVSAYKAEQLETLRRKYFANFN